MDQDDHTAFIQSATQSVGTPSILSSATSRRLHELEALLRRQQQETSSESTAISTQTASQQLAHIETKLGRLDNMDSLLNNNRVKLALTMKQQQDSHVQIVKLNNIWVSELMEVIDWMATRIESFNNTLFSGDNIDCNNGHKKDLSRTAHTTPESSQRRT